MPPCGSPPPGCPACTRCAPQTVRSGRGAVPPISRTYGVPALAGSRAPFPLFCPGASASTSEAPVVGVGVGHLVRTTSIGPGGPIHSPAGKSFRSACHPPSPGGGAIGCPTGRPGPPRTGWGSLPAADAVEVVRRLVLPECPIVPGAEPSFLPSSSVPWRRHIRTNSCPSVCLGEKDSS